MPKGICLEPYKIVLRLPKELGEKVKELARRDGVSINQWLLAAVARQVGTREPFYPVDLPPPL
jgi:predicted HicB family RNase H-like nuclease